MSQGGSGVPVALTGTRRNQLRIDENSSLGNENSSEKASSNGMSSIKATTKKRSMTMDDASTLELIIRIIHTLV